MRLDKWAVTAQEALQAAVADCFRRSGIVRLQAVVYAGNRASMRVLDLITPLGLGQRALIVAPPRGGKTVLLKTIASSLRANYPDLDLLILLLDERPEEVTDFEETVDAPVYASTFDEPSKRHAQLSDLVLERARRLVEQGRNVVIMLDSLTRLARGYFANQIGGRTMSGGIGSYALE